MFSFIVLQLDFNFFIKFCKMHNFSAQHYRISCKCQVITQIYLSVFFSRELGTSSYTPRDPASASHQPMAPPTVPLAYGGGAEGRKRRSPSSYKGKASKLSRPSGLESLFGKGNDSGGILASGPESPRQVPVFILTSADERMVVCCPVCVFVCAVSKIAHERHSLEVF